MGELVSEDLVLGNGVSLYLLNLFSDQVDNLSDSADGLSEASLFFRDDAVLGAGLVLELDELTEDTLDSLKNVGDSFQRHGLDADEVLERKQVQVGEGSDDAGQASFGSLDAELGDLGLGNLEELGGEVVEGGDEHARQDDVQGPQLGGDRLRSRLLVPLWQGLCGSEGDERHK